MWSKWENFWQDTEMPIFLSTSVFTYLLDTCTELKCTLKLTKTWNMIDSKYLLCLLECNFVQFSYKTSEKSTQYLIWKADQAYRVIDSDNVNKTIHWWGLDIGPVFDYFDKLRMGPLSHVTILIAQVMQTSLD